MAKTVEFNEQFFESILLSQGVQNLTKQAAERVAAQARLTAPVKTGAYRDGITVRAKRANHRVVHQVVGTNAKTMLVEAKTGNLARALKAAK